MFVGGKQVMAGHLTAGSLIAFVSFMTGYMYGPILRLIQINDQIARTNAALNRIFGMLDTEPNIKDASGAEALAKIQGAVRYEDVWFEYEPGQPVIKGVNLDVKAGQMVAFVGQSGSGKTTMINLLSRHYDVTGGAITIDGKDLRGVTVESLRRQVGVVIQETILFNTTVRENIRYGRLEATDAEVEAAAEAANIHHVIAALPKGYDTRIGEEGIKLSGGEKQRIAIARAILSDPRILVLDEATSALDSETETLIQGALDKLMEGRTSFCIAHRLSTIVKADLIVVMERGVVREAGSHHDLLASGGIYAGLYNQQFKVALEALPQ
jgi:subfamily B ATP-binding cassette protein MsbA